ncbi:TPA: RNA methyltransferase [Patescibacteria group bacterium]|nr:RNA methyltransferase [Patescibacteria group bacterium]|tara:strand:+ start:1635 stop:2141 length:507 start_codon:yes stop_codon:yes gene_type:complete
MLALKKQVAYNLVTMIAILNNIRSLHNVGSIFRTADGVGVDKLYLCGFTPSPLDQFDRARPQLAKVALGAEKMVSWEKCGQTSRLITRLKKEGYSIIALEINKESVPYYKIKKIKKKTALVVGHEVKGLPKSVLNKCDKIVEIPMKGDKTSLNVSVAFGVVAFALQQK